MWLDVGIDGTVFFWGGEVGYRPVKGSFIGIELSLCFFGGLQKFWGMNQDYISCFVRGKVRELI